MIFIEFFVDLKNPTFEDMFYIMNRKMESQLFGIPPYVPANTICVYKVNRRGHIKGGAAEVPYFETKGMSEEKIYNRIKNLLAFL